MLNEILRWFHSDRRTADRKTVHFPIAWYRGEEAISGVGVEISANGLLFYTKTPPPTDTFDVGLQLPNRKIRARVQVRRKQSGVSGGTEMTAVGCAFLGIAADDYDAIMRFLRDLPEPGNKAKDELANATAADDAYRLLPLVVQERIVQSLVAHKRLADNSDAKNPLLRMTYLGKDRLGHHRLAVHSRRHERDDVLHFDSVLNVDDQGNVKIER